MIPINPSSAYTRTARFVREEWNSYFDANGSTPVDTVQGGWRGLLYANLAIIDPKAAWDFFAQPNFDPSWLDSGASRTWYLAYAASEFFFSSSYYPFPPLEERNSLLIICLCGYSFRRRMKIPRSGDVVFPYNSNISNTHPIDSFLRTVGQSHLGRLSLDIPSLFPLFSPLFPSFPL